MYMRDVYSAEEGWADSFELGLFVHHVKKHPGTQIVD